MKTITSLIFILSFSPAYAEIYKCIENGKTSYQQTQCKQTGTEFVPAPDISIEQQKAAVNKLDSDLAAIAEKKKLQKEADDKERLLRIQEDIVKANRAQADETARQTDAIEKSINRIGNNPYPYRPLINPLPSRPEPGRPTAKPFSGPVAKPLSGPVAKPIPSNN